MAIHMTKTIKEERLKWIKPIIDKQIKLVDVIKVCPHSQRSLERWLSSYKKYGEQGLEPKSTRPKTNPKETSIRIKERVIELRKETNKCSLKLMWQLEEEKIAIHYQTIAKIIKKEGLTKKYRVRKIQYKYVKAVFLPGEMLETDIKYVPKKIHNKRYYQFTAIDCASRWRYLKAYDEYSKHNVIDFIKEVIKLFPYTIKAIKTDNHATFTNRYFGYYRSDLMFPREHSLDKFCRENNIIHYLIDPGKPAQNGKVERSHRSDQESFYNRIKFKNINELNYKLRLWNMYYNDLAHCSLNGKSPNQMLLLN